MDSRAFETLVAEMRDAQRDYFRRRSPEALERSKTLERRVDAALRDRAESRPLFKD